VIDLFVLNPLRILSPQRRIDRITHRGTGHAHSDATGREIPRSRAFGAWPESEFGFRKKFPRKGVRGRATSGTTILVTEQLCALRAVHQATGVW